MAVEITALIPMSTPLTRTLVGTLTPELLRRPLLKVTQAAVAERARAVMVAVGVVMYREAGQTWTEIVDLDGGSLGIALRV